MIIAVLMIAILNKDNDIQTWKEVQTITVASFFLIVFIFYIIILRKLILILSIKYPKFYLQEKKHIITTVSIILASNLMKIIELGL